MCLLMQGKVELEVGLQPSRQVSELPMFQDAKYNSHSRLNGVIACLQAEQAGPMKR